MMGSSIAVSGVSRASPQGLTNFLRSNGDRMLVLFAQDLGHWPAGALAASANLAALANNYHLISFDFHRSAERECALLQALTVAEVAGSIFLWDHAPSNLALYQRLAERRPCVQVIDPKPITGLDFVGVDEYSGGLLAVRHLLNLGYRQIGHISLQASMQGLRDRRQAYIDALRQAALPPREEWLLDLPYGFTETHRLERHTAIRRFLLQPQRPTALFVCADWLASELIECAHELGLSVPRDFALVGFDDSLPYCLSGVPLTTVRIDLQQIGRLAVERLLLRVHDRAAGPGSILVRPTLVVRESSAWTTPTTERWRFVLQHLHENFRRAVSAREVAGLIGLEAHYFSNQFHHSFGVRFTDYLNNLRLQFATQMLLTTDRNVEHIAGEAGFRSVNNFYTLFKRTHGLSPHAYRKQRRA